MKKIFDRVAHWKDRPKNGFSSSDLNSPSHEVDTTPQVVLAAARALIEGIEEILSDQSSLSGDDMSGFHRLLAMLESAAIPEDLHAISTSRGVGCLGILLVHMVHPSYVDICCQANLAPGLMHSLRLLRMMEVKHGNASSKEASGSVTVTASSRVCLVLSTLCAHNQTIEQLRPSLTKLLQLPLSALPESGLHFQDHVASVVNAMCRSGLTSQIVWCLRDNQTISVMTKSLRELTAISTSSSSDGGKRHSGDILLRGKAAEQRGMWIIATECLVCLLNASCAFSPVLMTEFEAAGGFDLLVHIVINSSRDRCMKIMNVVANLLVGDSRSADRPLMHPQVGAVLSGVLKAVLRIGVSGGGSGSKGSGSSGESVLTGEESVAELRQMSIRVAVKADTWHRAEFILQNLAYSLLTLYSSHSDNYNILEPKYRLLPMLTLCLPAFRVRESSSAVLKTADFVCSEGLGTFPILALCASASVMVQQCVGKTEEDGEGVSVLEETQRSRSTPTKGRVEGVVTISASPEERKRASKRLQQSLQFFEEVICREERYAAVFVKEGLRPMLCEHLANAENFPHFDMTEEAFVVYTRIIQLTVGTLRDHPSVAPELRASGLVQLAKTLIACPGVDATFSPYLLSVIEQLAVAEQHCYEINAETLVDLLNFVRGSHKKMSQVLDCISRVLRLGNEKVSDVWQTVDGFSNVISAIDSLEGAFSPGDDEPDRVTEEGSSVDEDTKNDANSDDCDETFVCLKAAILCLAGALTIHDSEAATVANRKYFREKVKYPTLTAALRRTGIFESQNAHNCVELVFSLVNGCERGIKIANPDAVAVVIDIIPYLNETTALRTVQSLKNHVFSQIDGCQLLSRAGIMRLFVEKFQSILRDSSHPLKQALTSLLLTLCGEYLTIVDFAAILRNLVRPDAILSERNQQLLPLWEVVDKKGVMAGRDWDSVQMLIDLTETSSSRSHGVSYASMGPSVSRRSGDDPAHLHMHWSEHSLGKPFPVSGFTFSCWAQLGDSGRRPSVDRKPSLSSERRSGVVPIFTVRGATGGVLEVQFDVCDSTAKIIIQARGKQPHIISFSVPYISEHEWHLIVITMKKSKRVVTSSKVTMSVFFDGQSIFSDKIEAEVPVQGPSVDIYVGKSLTGDRLHADSKRPDSASGSRTSKTWHSQEKTPDPFTEHCSVGLVELMKLWHIGPILFFDDALSQIQVSRIMTKGPTYTGIFQGESPLEDSISTVVTDMLCKCNSTFLDMDTLMVSLGLKGMELIVVPLLEGGIDEFTLDMPVCPVPVLAYSSTSAETVNSSSDFAFRSTARVKMHNSASEQTMLPYAELINGWHVSRVDSVAHCIGSLGGPAVLLPLVHAASSEKQLLLSLNLLKECFRPDSSNMKYMHTHGYGILSYLLSRKPKALLTEDVVECLFSWTVDRGLKSSNSSVFSVLLVDTLAFYHFFLNHQIWDIRRPRFAAHIIGLFRSLVCEDARHAALNAKRMSLLGLGRWIIHLLIFAADESAKCMGSTVSSSNDTFEGDHSHWTMRCRTVMEAASSRDSLDIFLSNAIYVLRAMVTNNLRQTDIAEIANAILRTLVVNDNLSNHHIHKRKSFSSSAVQETPSTDSVRDSGRGDRDSAVLTTGGSLRVGLLRLLRELYVVHLDSDEPHHAAARSKSVNGKHLTEAEITGLFSSVLTPQWFLVILEKSTDVATNAFCLRLLGTLLQRDYMFRRSFCATDVSLKSLQAILTYDDPEVPTLPVVLPMLALLFQIPMKFLPMPDDVTLQGLGDLMEKCQGPLALEPDLSDFTIPVFSIIMSCFSTNARQSAGKALGLETTIISGMISRALTTNSFDGMRDLMQHRNAIEVLVKTLLMCSNACDDYGSHIYSGDDTDLSASIQEDYISIDYGEVTDKSGETCTHVDMKPVSDNPRVRLLSEPPAPSSWSEVILFSPDGTSLEDIMFKVLHSAVTKYGNPQTVANFFLAFPKHITEAFVCGYHVLLFKKIKRVLKCVFEDMVFASCDVEDRIPRDMGTLQTACNVFTFLVPIARARLLHDTVLFDVLEVSLFALETIASTEASNWLLDKHSQFVKDIGSSARFFALLNIHSALNTAEGWNNRLHTLETIRANLHVLCLPVFDEVSDPSLLKSRREVDDRKGPLLMLEAYGMTVVPGFDSGVSTGISVSGSLGAKRSTNTVEASLVVANSDKCRISQMFSLLMLINSYTLFLDDDQKMRTEAMRVCAALLIHRRQFMLEVLSPVRTKKGTDTSDVPDNQELVLYNGFAKLIPDTVGGTSMYAKLLRNANVDYDGEEARIAEFSYWLTDNRSLCAELITSIDTNTAVAMPSIMSATSSVRELIHEKIKFDAHSSDEPALPHWNAEFSSQVNGIISNTHRWLVYGVALIARGCISWKQVWGSLQSSPVWGIKPENYSVAESAVSKESGLREHSSGLTCTPIDQKKCLDDVKVSWRLDFGEGPEKIRKRLEQDYDDEVMSSGNDVNVDENVVGHGDPTDTQNEISSGVEYEKEAEQVHLKEEVDMEELFKRMSQNKYLRKSSNSNADEVDVQYSSQFADIEELMQEDDGNDDEDEDIDDAEYDDRVTDMLDAPEKRDATSISASASDEITHDRSPAPSPFKKRISGKLFSAAMAFPDAVRSVVYKDGEDSNSHTGETSGSPPGGSHAFAEEAPLHMSKQSGYSVPALYKPSVADERSSRINIMLIEIVRGIIGVEEWDSGHCINISRVCGLEARGAMLVLTPSNVHVLDGFKVYGEGSSRRLEWTEVVSQYKAVEKVILSPAEVVASVSGTIDLPVKESTESRASKNKACPSDSDASLEKENQWLTKVWYQLLHVDYGYYRMPLDQVYTIFKRRYQLQNVAMEVTDIYGSSLLFACDSVVECESTLKRLLEMNMPQSIFYKVGMKNLQIAGGLFMYKRLMAYFLSNVTKLWQKGCISNLEYLMHLNYAAGRSFQDLTQYPVFPWVLADYESQTLNLNNPASYRDLSRPMGALGDKRAQQYAERFRTMDDFYKEGVEGCTPPFFYGTHYSCAGYVLYYLMRIQPYARMAISLQGGQFDKPDRLFKALEHSWLSASQDNLQDVRELIPEFYFLPEFLINANRFEFGETQKGEKVDDVQLPAWAAGDAIEFIRRHRQALESKHVSENLHNWIDLIFGYKQRGQAAENAMNVFIPLTYEGEVNIDAITDPMLREATLAQINNFGQTPARLFMKPHPKKTVPDVVKRTDAGCVVDSAGSQWHERMTPPLCVVGAPSMVWLNRVSYAQVLSPSISGECFPVGDVRIVSRDRLIAVPEGCALIPPKFVKFIRFGKTVGGVSIHIAQSSPRHLEVDREVSTHEQLHFRPVSCVDVCADGETIVTGGEDRSIRVWKFQKLSGNRRLEHLMTLCGHDGSILCVTICVNFSVVVSGSEDRTAMVWDLRGSKLLRVLGHHSGPVISVGVNSISGNIVTLTAGELRLYSLNGELLSSASMIEESAVKHRARVVLCPPSGDWQDGVVAVTGHDNGYVYLWKLKVNTVERENGERRVVRELVSYALTKIHRVNICSLKLSPAVFNKSKPLLPRVYEGENMYELLVGDTQGFVSRWAPGKLDHLTPVELQQVMAHAKSNTPSKHTSVQQSLNQVD